MKNFRHYRITEVHIVEREFQRLFGVSFRQFFAPDFSAIFKHVTLDRLKFDEWLHHQSGCPLDTPIMDIVREKYGEEAAKLLICLTT